MQTARGEQFGPGGLIPSTQGQDSGRTIMHDAPPDAADIALACYVASIENMEAEEVALIAPESTISEMRKSFPHATKLDEAETKLLDPVQDQTPRRQRKAT